MPAYGLANMATCCSRSCVAVCYSLSQYDAVCCSRLQCVAVCCSVLLVLCEIRSGDSLCCRCCCSYLSLTLLQSVAICCSLLQSVAVCCSLKLGQEIHIVLQLLLFMSLSYTHAFDLCVTHCTLIIFDECVYVCVTLILYHVCYSPPPPHFTPAPPCPFPCLPPAVLSLSLFLSAHTGAGNAVREHSQVLVPHASPGSWSAIAPLSL